MPSLNDLPAEILLDVATALANDNPGYCSSFTDDDHVYYTREATKDLLSLSLTSRRYRSIAQEVLHQTVSLGFQDDATLTSTWNHHLGMTPLAQFLRTLFNNPTLAHEVRDLRVYTSTRDMIHVQGCSHENNGSDATVTADCSCGVSEVVGVTTASACRQALWNSVWEKLVEDGNDTAIVASS
jgi:hypothetical protein